MFTRRTLLLAALVVIVTLAITAASAAPDPRRKSTAASADPVAVTGEAGVSKELVLHGMDVPSTQESAIRGMSTKQLKRFLRDRAAACEGCVEREHLVERAMTVRGWATADDRVAAQLTPLMDSAANGHLALHHIQDAPTDLPAGTIALLETPPMPNGDVIIGDRLCNAPLVNGTQFCFSISGMQDNARVAMAA